MAPAGSARSIRAPRVGRCAPEADGAERDGGARAVRPRIVVVDHEPQFLHLLEQLLSEEGYTVLVPGDLAQPYSFVKSALPDLVLLDVVYRRESQALTTLDKLRLDPATTDIPVLACSTTPSVLEGLRGRGQQPRPRLYMLVKPFDLQELLAEVERILREHAQPRPRGARRSRLAPL